jgi:hypothetical protein
MTRASLAAFHAAADEANHALRGEEITVNGSVIFAAITLGSVEVQRVDGGTQRVRTLTASIRKTILPQAPPDKSRIEYGGAVFTVDEVRGDTPTATTWFVRASLS